MLTSRCQVVNRASHGRTKSAVGPVIASPVDVVAAKQISIQQQFQLVTDEDDDEVSLKVLAQHSPSRFAMINPSRTCYYTIATSIAHCWLAFSRSVSKRDVARLSMRSDTTVRSHGI